MQISVLQAFALGYQDPVAAYNCACIHGKAGDVESGIGALRRAAEWGFPHPEHAAADPDLACLRAHEAWGGIVEHMRTVDNERKVVKMSMLEVQQAMQVRYVAPLYSDGTCTRISLPPPVEEDYITLYIVHIYTLYLLKGVLLPRPRPRPRCG